MSDSRNSSPSSDESFDHNTPVRRVSREGSMSLSPKNSALNFTKPMASASSDSTAHANDVELRIVESDAQGEVRVSEEVTTEKSAARTPVAENAGVCGFLYNKAYDTYKTLLCPEFFLLFNIFCIIQAVAALYYYISFFQKGFFLAGSAGMAPVWPATIGSISATIVGTALGPLPDGLVTKPFAIAVIAWYFVIGVFVFIATVCLGILGENRAVVWGVLCTLSGFSSGVFLLWLGLNFAEVKAKHTSKYKAVDSSRSTGDIEMLTSAGSDAAVASDAEEAPKKEPSTLEVVALRAVQALLWLVLFVFYMIPIGLAVGQAMTAREAHLHRRPGQLYRVGSAVNSTRIEIDMHLYCSGPTGSSRPTLLIEGDRGTTGFAYFNLQQVLSGSGYDWRVCTYDRAGYGWSEVSPLGSTKPLNTLARLKQLLEDSGEKANSDQFLLVGHGEGGELMQIFAAAYPLWVAGLALLDANPSDFRLHGLSGKQIKIDSKKICGNYQILRAMDSVAYARPVTDVYMDQAEADHTQFAPRSELARYKSTFTNGKYWASLYNDYCMRPAGFTLYTDTLTAWAGEDGQTSALDEALTYPIRWPALQPGVPVLVVVASHTLGLSNVYYPQAVAYNATLSPTNSSSLVICEGCHRSFPIDSHSSWLAELINSYFQDL